jgi:hypothetical protein
MTKEQYINCKELGNTVINLIQDKTMPDSFNTGLKHLVPDLSNDILSVSVNFDCPCKSKIAAHVFLYPEVWAEYVYNYGIQNNLKDKFDELISKTATIEDLPSLSGKIASTTIEEWSDFVKQIYNEGYQFYNFSVVKENDNKLLIFFM